jgi:hypothetical protein
MTCAARSATVEQHKRTGDAPDTSADVGSAADAGTAMIHSTQLRRIVFDFRLCAPARLSTEKPLGSLDGGSVGERKLGVQGGSRAGGTVDGDGAGEGFDAVL